MGEIEASHASIVSILEQEKTSHTETIEKLEKVEASHIVTLSELEKGIALIGEIQAELSTEKSNASGVSLGYLNYRKGHILKENVCFF